MNRTSLAALLTVIAGIAAVLSIDVLRSETQVLTFDTETIVGTTLRTVNGTPFPRSKGVATVTEPLAHVRLSLRHRLLLLGKRLTIRPRFHMDEGDVLEVGVKKTAFWLDYDRQPLAHRALDRLIADQRGSWKILRSNATIVFGNPRFDNPWQTVEEFEQRPPTDGIIGLYGNAALPISGPSSSLTPEAERRGPLTGPFRATDAPDTFRAIYASYQVPNRSDQEWTENEQRFNLARAYQNEDGSIDVMFFIQRRDQGPIRVLVDEISFRVEPGWPRAQDLWAVTRRSLVQLVKRTPETQ